MIDPCDDCRKAGFLECHGPHVDAALTRGIKAVLGLTPSPEDRRLLILYGITKAEKDKILTFQAGVCAGCLKPPVNIALGTDHDHKTGATRGLLCKECNKLLALARDKVETLCRLALYLQYPTSVHALGFTPKGRVGRSTRKWKTKREKMERMAIVNARLRELGYKIKEKK